MYREVGRPMLERESRTFYKIAMQSRNEKSEIAGERCKRGLRTSTNGTRYGYQLVLNLKVNDGFGGGDDGRTGRRRDCSNGLSSVLNPLERQQNKISNSIVSVRFWDNFLCFSSRLFGPR